MKLCFIVGDEFLFIIKEEGIIFFELIFNLICFLKELVVVCWLVLFRL